MQDIVDILCYFFRNHLTYLLDCGLFQAFQGFEMLPDFLFTDFPNAFHLVQNGLRHSFPSQLAMIGDGEAMHLILHLGQQEKQRAVAFYRQNISVYIHQIARPVIVILNQSSDC